VIDQRLKGVGDLAGVAQVVVEDQRDQRHRRGAVPTEHALALVGERKLMTPVKLQYCCAACTERSRGGADRAKRTAAGRSADECRWPHLVGAAGLVTVRPVEKVGHEMIQFLHERKHFEQYRGWARRRALAIDESLI